MKRRIGIIVTITLLSVLLISTLIGCSTQISAKEGMDYLAKCINNTKKATQYYIRAIDIESKDNSTEVQLTLFKDDKSTKQNEHAAKMTIIKSKGAKTTYAVKIWGDSLKKGVKAKKATAKDWKKEVMFTSDADGKTFSKAPVAMTFDEFITNNVPADLTRDALMLKLEALIASGVKPNEVVRQGRVTTYTFSDIKKENAELFGFKIKEGAKYPLIIETVNDHVSKISDNSADPKVKYYITMQGPNIHVPNWK